MAAGVAALEQATDWLVATDNASALAASVPYLKLAGDVIGGWILGRQALAAEGAEDPWLKSKGALARLYAAQVLSLAPGAAEGLRDGWEELEHVTADALAG